MFVRYTSNRIEIDDNSTVSAYNSSDLLKISIRIQAPPNPLPSQFQLKMNPVIDRWSLVIEHQLPGSPHIVDLSIVENQPTWVNGQAGAVQAITDLRPIIRKGCCPPQGVIDLSGVTCNNFFNPDFGLADELLVDCIIPSVDYSVPENKDALTPEQIGDICDIVPCDPTTVNGHESATPVITVVQGGSPTGTLNPITGVVIVPACEGAMVDINGSTYGVAPSGGSINIPVVNNAATPVGTIVPGVSVTIAPSQVRTTDGVVFVAGVPAEQLVNLPQSVIKYKDVANVDQVTAPVNTDFEDATHLNPALQIPRRQFKLTGGATLPIYADAGALIADTLPTIPQTVYATWGDGDGETLGVVLPAAMQGVPFSFVSETGTSGTITVSVNGGTTFAAPPFTAGAAKVLFRRTTSTLTSTATFRTA